MRFGIFFQIVAVCTFASSALAAPMPVNDKPGHPASPPPANAKPPAHNPAPAPAPGAHAPAPAPAAGGASGAKFEAGDIVRIKPVHILNGDGANVQGGAPNKPRPAVVVIKPDAAGLMGVAPIGHALPGASHTDDPSKYGIPNSANGDPNHLISTGVPAQIHVSNVQPVAGRYGLPDKLAPEHIQSLRGKIEENMDSMIAAKKQKVEAEKAEKEKAKTPAPPAHPAVGLYDDLPPLKNAAAAAKPAGGLYDDLPPPAAKPAAAKPATNNAAANTHPAPAPAPAPGAGTGSSAPNSKKRPLERRALYRRLNPITGERLSRRLHARSRRDW
ncbi:hypothetical protein JR316_0009243 [Psilocybe cubensis]|uniref:Uncharacterized protein n=2 Tax=Psilocybe cubensis TaxID=181762 RepID=A0A8H8CKU2_PSICU|nr:hypothetical protein JR316_0009243 [Psilocybe cubensis]KAH9478782.1 hypothetical protein JR316_0009243 [Psilocybe cubensis]